MACRIVTVTILVGISEVRRASEKRTDEIVPLSLSSAVKSSGHDERLLANYSGDGGSSHHGLVVFVNFDNGISAARIADAGAHAPIGRESDRHGDTVHFLTSWEAAAGPFPLVELLFPWPALPVWPVTPS